MIYSISEELPDSWDHIVTAFITMAEYSTEFNGVPEITHLNVFEQNGLLKLTYSGGNEITDAFAMMCRELSANVCKECGAPATRQVFKSPRCEACD